MTGRAPASAARDVPGVAVEWVGPLFREPVALRSDVAGFVGLAGRGPTDGARRLESAAEFDQVYGPAPAGTFLGAAVHGFFANGGTVCWVVRAVDRAGALPASATSRAGGVLFEATSEGSWANGTKVALDPSGRDRVAVTVEALDGRREFWRDLDLAGLRARFGADSDADSPGRGSADSVSALVRTTISGTARVPSSPVRLVLTGGADGLTTLTPAQVTGDETTTGHGAALLADIDEITQVAIPDLVARDAADDPALPAFGVEDVTDAVARLVGDCEALGRTALLQHPVPDALLDAVLTWRAGFRSAFAALYWPWLRVVDPTRPSRTLTVPPCGHVAGIVARSDRGAGPHKPPANEAVTGVVALRRRVDDRDHSRANTAGVNVIRPVPGRGIRVLGARTLSDESSWRYLNVRRLVTQIERGVAAYAAWTVFEPADQALRNDVERVVRRFLDDLWRAGGLEGRTAEDAYDVTVEDAGRAGAGDDGRLVVEIAVQPPWPAEFVVVRIDVSAPGARSGGAGGGRDGDDG
jgi:hypothetical protein